MGRRILFLSIISVFIALFLRLFIIEGIYVASGSMKPTYQIGAQLFLEKITFMFRNPQRGEIIVFSSPVREHHDLIKRVIGLPGDEIRMINREVFVNGEKLEEDYVQYTRAGERLKGDTIESLVVPAGAVFVLGDNRDESNDSRDWKDKNGNIIHFISISSIKGRVISLY